MREGATCDLGRGTESSHPFASTEKGHGREREREREIEKKENKIEKRFLFSDLKKKQKKGTGFSPRPPPRAVHFHFVLFLPLFVRQFSSVFRVRFFLRLVAIFCRIANGRTNKSASLLYGRLPCFSFTEFYRLDGRPNENEGGTTAAIVSDCLGAGIFWRYLSLHLDGRRVPPVCTSWRRP